MIDTFSTNQSLSSSMGGATIFGTLEVYTKAPSNLNPGLMRRHEFASISSHTGSTQHNFTPEDRNRLGRLAQQL